MIRLLTRKGDFKGLNQQNIALQMPAVWVLLNIKKQCFSYVANCSAVRDAEGQIIFQHVSFCAGEVPSPKNPANTGLVEGVTICAKIGALLQHLVAVQERFICPHWPRQQSKNQYQSKHGFTLQCSAIPVKGCAA